MITENRAYINCRDYDGHVCRYDLASIVPKCPVVQSIKGRIPEVTECFIVNVRISDPYFAIMTIGVISLVLSFILKRTEQASEDSIASQT